MLYSIYIVAILGLSVYQVQGLTCPSSIGKGTPFSVALPTAISIDKTVGVGSLCTLTLELDNALFIPIARSYDGNDWERAGGSFTAGSPEWVCSGSSCSSTIPAGNKYVLQTRSMTETGLDFNAELARFLESASFGAKPTDLSTWSGKSFAQHIKDQVNTPMTSHRELFRRLANPRWTFNKPEFAGNLDPCAPNSTWRRQILTTTDRRKFVNVGKVGDRWEIKVDGHVRSMVPQLRFINAVRWYNDTIADGGSYEFCSTEEEVRRNIYKLRINSNCRPLISNDLTIDFPVGFTPVNSVEGSIPALEQFQKISSHNLEYLFADAIIATAAVQSSLRTTSLSSISTFRIKIFCRPVFKFLTFGLFCRNNGPTGPTPIVPGSPTSPTAPAPAPSPVSSCKLTSPSSTVNAPLFAKTSDGIWLQHDPRIDMKANSLNEPLPDGGLGMLKAKKTLHCSNVARSFFNENKCIMSKVPACYPGSSNQSFAATGTIVCGSPGEISNDPTTGDNWLELSSIDSDRSSALGLPVDTTNSESIGRQREFIWSETSLKANDQLRQRIAFALLHIFSLPKLAIGGESQYTELFLIYYDIFVRNAFGNYGDILREISYNALNAESLSYVESRSVAHAFAYTKVVVFPDENYARELMQLFTVGLFELNMDGTPAADVNGTIQTYNSDDILSFAKVWTAFRKNSKRANVETIGSDNRYDPMRLDAERRDRFPKTDLAKGYIGDYYPLCVDLPAKAYLSVGAKYRLLGLSPLPELKKQKWAATPSTQYLKLQSGSSLYSKLCDPLQTGACSYPSVVLLDNNLACDGIECSIDTVQVLQVDSVFYEYVRVPCVEQPFFMNGIKISGKWRDSTPICTNPLLPVASEACCFQNVTESWKKNAVPACLITGEVMTWNTAQSHCASIDRGLCDYQQVNATDKCPLFGSYWTTESCVMRVKVSSDGQAALVHKFYTTNSTLTELKSNTPNFFKVYWKDSLFPSVANNCGGGQCDVFEDACVCNVTVLNAPYFVSSSPTNAAEILQQLRIGHPGRSTLDINTAVFNGDYKYYGKTQLPLDQTTVFEVVDRNGQTKFIRNLKSTVTIAGTSFEFRNPPQFNSILSVEYSIADAHHETEAALDHLLYHKNTAPFLAYRFIQRFGVSNPTPRYVKAVANAFRTGSYNNGISFGKGKYGDMEATIAAVLLDREARSVVLDKDPAQGTLREPILKVLSFMRALDFKSSSPLVELDYMEQKVGQMAYEQASVFSFFRPEYSPSELAGTGLTAPESQAMSSTSIVGLMNGLFSLIKYGLNECNGGFGAFGDCSTLSPSGNLTYVPSNIDSPTEMVRDLSYLLTGGRLMQAKQLAIVSAIAAQPNATSKYQLALQLLVSSPEFHSTSSVDLLAPAEKPPPPPKTVVPPTQDYKVVILLMFRGGCDSFNVLVPSSSCGTLHQEYVEVRGAVGLTPAQTIPLSGDAKSTQQACSNFAVHSGLSTLQKLYSDQDLLFMANVGVLTQYVNRTNYSIRTETPLFSHNSMQDEVVALDPWETVSGTGVLGRMADVLQEKGYETARTTIDAPSSNLASRSGSTPPIFSMSARGVSIFNVVPSSPTMNSAIQQLNNGISGIYGDLWSTMMKRSINQTDELSTIMKNQTKTVFPSTALGNRLKVASQLIASRVARGVDRDVFFIPFDGFDTHSEVTKTLESRFAELNDALEDFVTELKLLGVWDNTAIVQASDFGRTMTGNSGGGTDHGWGGNYWLAGGGVKGQRIVGKYPPTFSLNYEFNIDRGRIIPTTSWDSVFNSITEWMGVTNTTDLRRILPNRNKFSDIFPSSMLFN